MNLIFEDTVPLEKAVKAAAIDMGEDFTKVEATYSHLAVRGLKDISNKLLRLGGNRGLFPVHKSFKTVAIPLGAKRITFVGLIDECGYKVPLTSKENIVGKVSEELCVDKCPACNQDKDICENLQTTETVKVVSITDSTGTNNYTNTVSTFYENGRLFIENKSWILNVTKNLAELVIETHIEPLTQLDCGCIEPSVANISTIKDNCGSCYETCYTPCRQNDQDLGGYRVLESVIQLDLNIPYEKVYLEWEGMLPKKNGVFHIPSVSFETLVAYIKYRATWDKISVDRGRRIDNKNEYTTALKSCQQQVGRMSLSRIIQSIHKLPKFNVESISSGSCLSLGSTFFSGGTSAVQNNAPTPIINVYQGGTTTGLVPRETILIEAIVGGQIVVTGTGLAVTGIAAGSTTISSLAFVGKEIEVWRGNLLLMQINPGDGSNYFTKAKPAADIVLNQALGAQEPLRIKSL